jgi:hypothetical protein
MVIERINPEASAARQPTYTPIIRVSGGWMVYISRQVSVGVEDSSAGSVPMVAAETEVDDSMVGGRGPLHSPRPSHLDRSV